MRLGHLQCKIQPVEFARLPANRVLLVPQSFPLCTQLRVLAGQHPDCVLEPLRSLQVFAQLTGLVLQMPDPVIPGLQRRQELRILVAQPGEFLVQRLDRAALARLDADFGKARLQTHDPGLQGRRLPCRPAEFLGLLLGRSQLVPALAELRFPRTRIAAGGHFGPTQLLAARFRRIRPRLFPIRTGTLPLVQCPRVHRLTLRPGYRRKPYPLVKRDRHPIRDNISVENHHAHNDSAWISVLPVPSRELNSIRMTIRCQILHGPPKQLPSLVLCSVTLVMRLPANGSVAMNTLHVP